MGGPSNPNTTFGMSNIATNVHNNAALQLLGASSTSLNLSQKSASELSNNILSNNSKTSTGNATGTNVSMSESASEQANIIPLAGVCAFIVCIFACMRVRV